MAKRSDFFLQKWGKKKEGIGDGSILKRKFRGILEKKMKGKEMKSSFPDKAHIYVLNMILLSP